MKFGAISLMKLINLCIIHFSEFTSFLLYNWAMNKINSCIHLTRYSDLDQLINDPILFINTSYDRFNTFWFTVTSKPGVNLYDCGSENRPKGGGKVFFFELSIILGYHISRGDLNPIPGLGTSTGGEVIPYWTREAKAGRGSRSTLWRSP